MTDLLCALVNEQRVALRPQCVGHKSTDTGQDPQSLPQNGQPLGGQQAAVHVVIRERHALRLLNNVTGQDPGRRRHRLPRRLRSSCAATKHWPSSSSASCFDSTTSYSSSSCWPASTTTKRPATETSATCPATVRLFATSWPTWTSCGGRRLAAQVLFDLFYRMAARRALLGVW